MSIIDEAQLEAKELYDASEKYITKLNSFKNSTHIDMVYVDYANDDKLIVIFSGEFRKLVMSLIKNIKEIQ